MRQSKFQFLNPYLEKVNFVTNQDFESDADVDEIEIQNTFDIQVKKSMNENRARVSLTLKVNAENKEAPFELEIKVVSDFKWEDMDENKVNSMLNVNAPALLLGYMRPIVSSITNSSALPVYNIPFINFKE